MSKAAAQIMFSIAISSIIVAAMFGFSAMNESGHMMVGCFGSTPWATCSMFSPIEHFAAHLHAFQSISTAVVQITSLLASLLLFALARSFLAVKQISDPQRDYITRQRDSFVSPQRIQLLHWTALHEKRDPSFARAVNR